MNSLIGSVSLAQAYAESSGLELPFSIYRSLGEQKLHNVPVLKPMLIVVLGGEKQLGTKGELFCGLGQFIFLSDHPAINMRNIPKADPYLALLIEFELHDFSVLENTMPTHLEQCRTPTLSEHHLARHCTGLVTEPLELCLRQFVESVTWAPKELWAARRKELLLLLQHLGFGDVFKTVGHAKLSYRIYELFRKEPAKEYSMAELCTYFALSESTLRRRLSAEGSGVQAIKDQVRLGLGLHLLQTTELAIGLIAERCAYSSASRFTERFKERFALTPSELRKTRVTP
ncbi:helix-turn-helix transcriptional regulator [Agaribacterium sp. ZY112]|uniref:helix-turn-helix transcriptional regulator n=1 Tax=Agaribacterium sp. ZY112 TaxID=3233574 RepID=UPI003524FA10